MSNNIQKKRTPKDGPNVNGGSKAARKTAALVLEVWAGELHPSEAAAALEVGMPRYYQIEKKAFAGVVSACEPCEQKGRQKSEAKVMEELRLQIRHLERDLKRSQALARLGRKAEGIATVVAQAKKSRGKNGRKRRRPVSRALKVAKTLQKETEDTGEEMPINMVSADSRGAYDDTRAQNKRCGAGGKV